MLDNGTPDKAVDGVKENSWNVTDCANTDQGNMTDRAWWTVDLGDEYRVTGIKIFNRDKQRKFVNDYSLLLFNVIAIVACFESHRYNMKCVYCNRQYDGVHIYIVMQLRVRTIIIPIGTSLN